MPKGIDDPPRPVHEAEPQETDGTWESPDGISYEFSVLPGASPEVVSNLDGSKYEGIQAILRTPGESDRVG